jgi:phospholipase/carboxylesterase
MARHERIGKLKVLKSGGAEDDLAVVLLHGFGADASDLFPLHEVLDPEGRWTWYFPEAPLEVPIGPGFMGRAWFPISLAAMNVGFNFASVRPPGLDDSSTLVKNMLNQIPEKKVVIGGFSQGAMVATEVALRDPKAVAGLLVLSGTLLDEESWRTLAPAAAPLKFLSCHGQQDPVLPYSGGQKLYELLKKSGLTGKHVAFPGGHEIPMQALAKTREFLEDCLK